ncbi:MAG TPA: hypothetical protein VK805_09655 [Candidatus Baltobacteraceae bacterium]|jgi:hypothetical protein|nr:hypothetical protein [Candidatus Baltobacteraceae bacterium]
MKATENTPIKIREELKNKRKLLFKLFLNNPMHTSLAVDIKALDDQLADWTQTACVDLGEAKTSSTHFQ